MLRHGSCVSFVRMTIYFSCCVHLLRFLFLIFSLLVEGHVVTYTCARGGRGVGHLDQVVPDIMLAGARETELCRSLHAAPILY